MTSVKDDRIKFYRSNLLFVVIFIVVLILFTGSVFLFLLGTEEGAGVLLTVSLLGLCFSGAKLFLFNSPALTIGVLTVYLDIVGKEIPWADIGEIYMEYRKIPLRYKSSSSSSLQGITKQYIAAHKVPYLVIVLQNTDTAAFTFTNRVISAARNRFSQDISDGVGDGIIYNSCGLPSIAYNLSGFDSAQIKEIVKTLNQYPKFRGFNTTDIEQNPFTT